MNYNHKNERNTRGYVANNSASNVIQYVYDEESHLIGEYSGATPIVEYVWLGDKPVAAIYGSGTASKIYYIVTDHLNTPRRLVDSSNQAIVWSWDSTAFGVGTPVASVTFNLRFPGQYYDVGTGHFYNHNRFYNPELGRYMEPDPIGLEGGLNPYAYAGNNPVSNADPSGLFSFDVPSFQDTLNNYQMSQLNTMLPAASFFFGGAEALGAFASAAINTFGIVAINDMFTQPQPKQINLDNVRTQTFSNEMFKNRTYIPIYRTMNTIELGRTTKSQSYSLTFGAMETKQFVFNPNEAKSFANYFSTNENRTYGVVTSSISRSTFNKAADISWSIDRDRVSGPVITFSRFGLNHVNNDARQTGGIKLLCTTPRC